jgi:hypothetical protein
MIAPNAFAGKGFARGKIGRTALLPPNRYLAMPSRVR